MFIDTHTHLYWDSLLPKIDQILLDAKNAKVEKIICIWCNEKDTQKSKEIAEKYEQVYFTVWIHPTDTQWNEDWGQFEKLIHHPKCVWIGECGFDFYHKPFDEKMQEIIFEKQINLAEKLNKPLIIHSREAWEKTLEFIKDFKWKFVIHCFTENQSFADQIIKLWGYISIWWIITYPKASELRDIIKNYPLEKIMLETDCPFLAPQHIRWQTNEPKYIPEIANKLSKLKWIPIESVESKTTSNVFDFFGI